MQSWDDQDRDAAALGVGGPKLLQALNNPPFQGKARTEEEKEGKPFPFEGKRKKEEEKEEKQRKKVQRIIPFEGKAKEKKGGTLARRARAGHRL